MWKNIYIENKETEFEISDEGIVRNKYTKKIKKQYDHTGGYKQISLKGKLFLVHRLVAEIFNPVDDMCFLEVNHKDFDKTNNKLSNLEWVTQSENNLYNYKNNHHSINKIIHQYSADGQYLNSFYSLLEAERQTGVRQPLISGFLSGVYKSAGGFQWSLKKVNSLPPLKKLKRYSRKVSQIDIETNQLIKIFDSASEASRKTNINQGSITRACQGKRKKCRWF